MIKVNAVACLTPDGVYADGDKQTFHVYEDRVFFKQATEDRTVIVGRKTFEDMGPLSGRDVIVVASDPIAEQGPGVYWAGSICEACHTAVVLGRDITIAGGKEIWEAFSWHVQEWFITILEGPPQRMLRPKYFPVDILPSYFPTEIEVLSSRARVLKYEERNAVPF